MGNIVRGKFLYITSKGSDGDFDFKAYATSHTLSQSAETTEVAHKTDGAGFWTSAEVNKLSWEVSSENLYTEEVSLPSIGSEVDIQVSYDKGAKITAAGTQAGTATGLYYGKAIITSININAAVSDNATYSVTLTGKGELKAGTAPSA